MEQETSHHKDDGDSNNCTRKGSLRLLLHAVDGCIPYLNPSQLEVHFPPSEDFWIGLAVRDTCVVPVFDKPSAKQMKKEKTTRSDTRDEDKSCKRSAKKARGYTFAALKPDPWLLPYTRLTVPAFDLQDGDNKNSKNSNGMVASKSKEGNSNNNILVWTPHGRQKLTPDLYSTAALDGLLSQHTLSLFDMNEDADDKRAERTQKRNQQWFEHLVGKINPDFESTDTPTIEMGFRTHLWAPFQLPKDDNPSNGEHSNDDDSKSHCSPPIEYRAASGVAFIGQWRPGYSAYIQPIQATWKAVLSTNSLSEILEIATEGNINVIGTGLPASWAKKKLALGINIIDVLDDEVCTSRRSSKRQKVKGDDSLSVSLDANGCMDLTNKAFAGDARPLVVGCTCMACNHDRFSRAYIHHLVCAKELLAEILIFGHNLHSLLRLIRAFNASSNRSHVRDATELQIDSNGTANTMT